MPRLSKHLRTFLFLLGFASLASATDPYNLRVDGIYETSPGIGNMHVLGTTLRPQYCWDYPGTQANWEVQMDDDPTFAGCDFTPTPTQTCSLDAGHRPFYVDTGTDPKTTAQAAQHCYDRDIDYPAGIYCKLVANRGFNADLEYRPFRIPWRVRVQDAVTGLWSNWVASTLKLNFPPLWPETISAVVDANSSTDPIMSVYNPAAGTTYYLDGDDANAVDAGGPGSSGVPFRTFTYATKQLSAGDTLKVRDVSPYYAENVNLTSGTHRNGNETNPITVIADTGHNPIVAATGTAIRIGGVHDWVFDGIDAATLSTTGNYGILIENASDIVIKNFTTPAVGLEYYPSKANKNIGIGVNSSTNIRIVDSLFNRSLLDQLELLGGNDITIRGCEFTTTAYSQAAENIRHAVHAHTGAHGNVLVDSCFFHDENYGEGFIYNYKGNFLRVTNSVFYNGLSTSDDQAWAVVSERSGPFQFENNTVVNMFRGAVKSTMGTGYVTFRNNIVMRTGGANLGFGVYFGDGDGQLGTTTRGSIVDNNLFYNLTLAPTGITIGSASGSSVADFDHTPAGNITATDPNFSSTNIANVATTFLRLDTGGGGSAAINTGLTASPVPTSGSTKRDIGRFESGETNNSMYKLYTYQPKVSALMDATPRFTWVLRDEDNLLELCCDMLPLGDSDYQTKFQIQIDESPQFNTRSAAHPNIESGTVTSTLLRWTVPTSRALDRSKQYYFRVRQADDEEPASFGPWSDAMWAFSLDADSENAGPVITSLFPVAGSAGNNCNTNYVSGVNPYLSFIGLRITATAYDEGGTIIVYGTSDGIRLYVDGVEQPIPDITGGRCYTVYSDANKANALSCIAQNLANGTHTVRFLVRDNLSNFTDSGTYNITCGTGNGGNTPGQPRIYIVP